MGTVPSTPRWDGGGGGERRNEAAEYLNGTFIGEKSFPMGSDYWEKLLELPISLYWAPHNHPCLRGFWFCRNGSLTRYTKRQFRIPAYGHILVRHSWDC